MSVKTAPLHSTTLKRKSIHEEFRTLAENSPDVICRFGKEFHHLYVNPAIERVTGIPTTVFVGKTPHEVMPKEFADYWAVHLTKVFATGEHATMEFTFPSKQGDRHFQSLLVPEHNVFGEVETVLTMSRDITEIKIQQQQKDEFIGIVSHELKTPLTSIKAFTQVLHKRFVKAKDLDSAEHLEKMDMQLNKLASLINDLLDVTKIQEGRLQFVERYFDFNELVKENVDIMQRTTEQHKIIVRGKVERKIYGDRDRIGQVLTNLLSNAIKYSPDSLEVIVKLSSTKEELTCCVQDFGVGVPKNMRDKIFDRFFRVSGSRRRSYPGLGLGLFISSEIIKRQSGKIWVESDKNGSIFCFTMPIKKKKSAPKVAS